MSRSPLPTKTARNTIALLAVVTAVAATSCRKSTEVSEGTGKPGAGKLSSPTSPAASKPSSESESSDMDGLNADPVHGLWSQQPFSARSAVVNVDPKWIMITLLNRTARCDSARLTPNDLAIQLTVPSGPNNDFFTGRNMPIELRLHGAKGVSHIPPGYVTVNLDPFDPTRDHYLQGKLAFRFRTAHDEQAPSYQSDGMFRAIVCNPQRTKASATTPATFSGSLTGNVSGRQVHMPTVHVYQRDNGFGQKILLIKAFEGNVPCHTTRSATPYLFGVELSADPKGQYTLGKPLPAPWHMQMRVRQFSERSVQSANGASWIQLDSIMPNAQPNTQKAVTGRLVADNADDDPDWKFFIEGQFEATMCGTEVRAW